MHEGLYKIEFETQRGQGNGVVYLSNGHLWGGDSAMYYVGTYNLKGERFSAEVKLECHTKYPGVTSVFGVDSATLSLKGQLDGSGVTTKGTSEQAPGVKFVANLHKLSR